MKLFIVGMVPSRNHTFAAKVCNDQNPSPMFADLPIDLILNGAEEAK